MSRNSLPSGNWRFDPFAKVQRFVPAPANTISEKGRELKPCGTTAAYRRHRYNGEEACDECMEAQRAERADLRRKAAEERAA